MNLNKFDEIDSLIRGVEFIVENSEFHELFYYDTPQVRFGKIQIFNEFLSGKILGFFNFFSFGNLNWSYSIFNIFSMKQTRRVSTNIFLEPAKSFFMAIHICQRQFLSNFFPKKSRVSKHNFLRF